MLSIIIMRHMYGIHECEDPRASARNGDRLARIGLADSGCFITGQGTSPAAARAVAAPRGALESR